MNSWYLLSPLVVIVPYIAYWIIPTKKKRVFTYAYGEANAGEGVPRRNTLTKELVTTASGCATLYESFLHAAQTCADAPCFGVRETIREETKETEIKGVKKTWTFYERSAYKWFNYQESFDIVTRFASGLRAIGIEPKEKLAIFEETCFEWTIAEQACYTQSIILLTVYANLGIESLAYALSTAKVSHIMTNATLLSQLVKIKDSCHLTHVVYIGKIKDEKAAQALRDEGIKLLSYDDVLEMGTKNPQKATPPAPSDLACIMYTSGSTGLPKGVMISHANMIGAVGGFGAVVGVKDGDCYLNYLPLAHVLAMVVENAVIHYGAKMGFGNPKTLTEDNMVPGCLGDLRELGPTAFAGVPLVYDRIKAGIMKKVNAESFVKRMIFKFAIAVKQYAWRNGKSTPLLNKVVFDQFKDRLGGNMRFMVSGGAPISSTAHLFLCACFGIPLMQGYGLTETCGAGTVMQMDDRDQGSVGPPVPCVEIKLVDVPDMGYVTSANPPKGEIWVRGSSVCTGYYLNPEKTAEAFTADGWFKTGDVGLWNKDGTLSIVDRIKNLVKNPYGEYIALEKLEAIYKNSGFVLNACVYACTEEPRIVAIVQPQPVAIDARPDGDITKDAAFAEEIKKDLIKTGKVNGLKRFELVTDVLVVSEEWSPLNNMLTAAMKLNRRSIYKTYRSRIDSTLA